MLQPPRVPRNRDQRAWQCTTMRSNCHQTAWQYTTAWSNRDERVSNAMRCCEIGTKGHRATELPRSSLYYYKEQKLNSSLMQLFVVRIIFHVVVFNVFLFSLYNMCYVCLTAIHNYRCLLTQDDSIGIFTFFAQFFSLSLWTTCFTFVLLLHTTCSSKNNGRLNMSIANRFFFVSFQFYFSQLD